VKRPAFVRVGLALSLSFVAREARALEPGDTDVEVGQQVSILFDGTVTRNLSYALFRTKPVIARNDATGSTWELRLGARVFYDFAQSSSEVAIRSLALLRRTEHLTATVGFQEIVWGETLGFPVADLVNPRDLRDPLFLDVDFVRLPVLAANVQYTLGPFRAQAVFTPFPRTPLLPASGSPFLPHGPPLLALPSFPVEHAGKDAEGGGRLGYLVGGWDLAALFLTHWSRVPAYELVITNAAGATAIMPVLSRVDTFGLSLSKPFGEHVLVRADSVLNVNQLQQSPVLAPPALVVESQTVVEGDLTLDDDWAFSLQYEYDRQGNLDRHWASGRAQKGLFERRLDLSVFAYKGVNNGDAWIEPSVSWSFLEYFTAQVRADFVWGTIGDAGQLGYFDRKNRVFAILRARL
jgi:hypothetical protein